MQCRRPSLEGTGEIKLRRLVKEAADAPDGDRPGIDGQQAEAQSRNTWGQILCRLGKHLWERRGNEDGKGYVACARCQKDYYMDGTEPTEWRIGGSV